MGDAVLAAADLPPGCTEAIAQDTPTEAFDTRAQVADLARHEGPGRPGLPLRRRRASCARRARSRRRQRHGPAPRDRRDRLRAAADPRLCADRARRLVQAQVPADTPLALAVVDTQGRAFQTHTNWIQVRPGERRTCDGCHSPRRGASLNSGTAVNTVPAACAGAGRAHQSAARPWPPAHAAGPGRADAGCRHAVHRHLGRHHASRRAPARDDHAALPGQPERAADDLATPAPRQRRHQLPGTHPAAVDARTRRRQQLH
jgi:hypothetical protein